MNLDINKIKSKFITVPYRGFKSLPNSLQEILNDETKPSFTTGSPLRVSFNHKHQIARQL